MRANSSAALHPFICCFVFRAGLAVRIDMLLASQLIVASIQIFGEFFFLSGCRRRGASRTLCGALLLGAVVASSGEGAPSGVAWRGIAR